MFAKVQDIEGSASDWFVFWWEGGVTSTPPPSLSLVMLSYTCHPFPSPTVVRGETGHSASAHLKIFSYTTNTTFFNSLPLVSLSQLRFDQSKDWLKFQPLFTIYVERKQMSKMEKSTKEKCDSKLKLAFSEIKLIEIDWLTIIGIFFIIKNLNTKGIFHNDFLHELNDIC